MERSALRNVKMSIPSNKIPTQTGVMISKIPFDDRSSISYEYYAWIGNKLFPINTTKKTKIEYIKTRVKLLKRTEKAIFIETKLKRQDWLPRSQLNLEYPLEEAETGKWINIRIPMWLYYRKSSQFGII